MKRQSLPLPGQTNAQPAPEKQTGQPLQNSLLSILLLSAMDVPHSGIFLQLIWVVCVAVSLPVHSAPAEHWGVTSTALALQPLQAFWNGRDFKGDTLFYVMFSVKW